MNNILEPPRKKQKTIASTVAAEALISCSFLQESPVSHEVEECSPKATRADGKKHVAKGTLTEADLIEAKRLAKTKKTKEDMTEEEKKEERRAANRLSAFQSRQRRKIIIEDLQKTVAQISKDNAQQRKEKETIKAELDSVKKENEMLRSQLSALGGTGSNSQVPNTFVNQLHSLLASQQLQPEVLLAQSIMAAQYQQNDQARGLLSQLMDKQRQEALFQTQASVAGESAAPGGQQSTASPLLASANPNTIAQLQQNLYLLAKNHQNANK